MAQYRYCAGTRARILRGRHETSSGGTHCFCTARVESAYGSGDFSALNIIQVFKGRLVFRLLENRAEWKKTDEGLMTWMMFNALKSPLPYVLSTRAV